MTTSEDSHTSINKEVKKHITKSLFELQPPQLKLEFKKLSYKAISPKPTPDGIGYFLYATTNSSFFGDKPIHLNTDISFIIPTGYCGRLIQNIFGNLFMHPMTIDSNNRGNITPIFKDIRDEGWNDIKRGDIIAILVIEKVYSSELSEVQEMEGSPNYVKEGEEDEDDVPTMLCLIQ
jgi:dUTPase